ncbi:MAG: hypothetical protein JW846_05710 [Dehalococcoidia bacterium]|nr:hypothetical protein [Dehalococcoidia bacterium]
MTTLADWVVALTVARAVDIDSSTNLVSEVRAQQLMRVLSVAKGKQAPTYKQGLVPEPRFLQVNPLLVSPLELLHTIGLVTTPSIPNLARLSATWAVLRYIWAFVPTHKRGAPLKLSAWARSLDFHQKGLLSDEVGVGMAAVLMRRCLGKHRHVDITEALEDPKWPIKRSGARLPDYLFYNKRSDAVIVECKGTQSERSASMAQLCSGTGQLPSITWVSGASMPSYVVATWLQKAGTRVFALDPDEELTPDWPVDPVGKWSVIDDNQLMQHLELRWRAKLSCFAGDFATAHKLVSAKAKPTVDFAYPAIQMDDIKTALGQFVGTKGDLILGGVRIEVFRGMLRGMADTLRRDAATFSAKSTEALDLLEPTKEYTERCGEEGFLIETQEVPGAKQVNSYTGAGTVLQLTISE